MKQDKKDLGKIINVDMCFICLKPVKGKLEWNHKKVCSKKCKEELMDRCQEYDLNEIWK